MSLSKKIHELTTEEICAKMREFKLSEDAISKFKDNNIDGDVIKYFSNEHLSLMIKDVGGQIKFGLMMKHLKANESKIIAESNVNVVIYDDETDLLTTSSNESQSIDSQKSSNPFNDSQLRDISEYNEDSDTIDVSDKNMDSLKVENLLKDYYEKIELPDFPVKMEEMLRNDIDVWSNRTKRHSLTQFLANFYNAKIVINNQNGVQIGFAYQPVALKLLKKYENLSRAVNEELVQKNGFIIANQSLPTKKKRVRLYQAWQLIAEPFSRRVRNQKLITKQREMLIQSSNIQTKDKTGAIPVLVESSVATNATESPALKRKLKDLKISSPKVAKKDCQLEKKLSNDKLKVCNDSNIIKESQTINVNTSNSSIEITSIKSFKNNNEGTKPLEQISIQSMPIQQEFHNELIKRFEKKHKKIDEMKTLLKGSFNYRREYFKKSQKLFLELLEEFIYFKESFLLEYEFELILKKSISQVNNEVKEIFKKLWKYHEIEAKDELSGYAKIVTIVEKDIRKKNVKQESLIYTGKNLKDNHISAPRLHLISENISIVFKDVVLYEIKNKTFENAISMLFSFYFIFDMKYPIVFSQILGLLHKILFRFEEMSIEENVNVCKINSYLSS